MNELDSGCFICGKPRHIAKHCYRNEKGPRFAGNKQTYSNHTQFNNRSRRHIQREQGNLVTGSRVERILHAAEQCASMVVMNDNYKNDEWTIDLGSTSHISPNIRGMTNIRTYQSSTDVAGENRTLEAEAIGDIGVITKIIGQEGIIRIKDVLYVPRLRSNLLSVSKLNNEGIKIIFKCGIAEMVDPNNEIIPKLPEHDRIYIFKAKPLQNCNQITGEELEIKAKGSVNQNILWHKRLGYVCEAYMDKMKTNTSVRDLSYVSEKLEICEACTMGKLRPQ